MNGMAKEKTMNIDTVIEKYETIIKGNFFYNHIETIAIILLLIFLALMVVLPLPDMVQTIGLLSVVILAFACGFIFEDFSKYKDTTRNKQLMEWEQAYLNEYLDEQPEEKLDLVGYNFVNQADTKEVNTLLNINVLYKKKSNEVANQYVKAKVITENTNSPYLTYKMLEKSISKEYNDGRFYEPVLHIPEAQ